METILVVDDEDDIRTVVRKMLEAKGYTVLETGDPHQALRIATQQPVHLLLTDVVMPLLRGTELAQRFQAVSPWTKVLLMSAFKVSEITVSGYPFIPKPSPPRRSPRRCTTCYWLSPRRSLAGLPLGLAHERTLALSICRAHALPFETIHPPAPFDWCSPCHCRRWCVHC